MPARYYEYVISFRPWRKGRQRTTRAPAEPLRTVKIVSHSKFDAEWEFRSKHPQMTIISNIRGKQVTPPKK